MNNLENERQKNSSLTSKAFVGVIFPNLFALGAARGKSR